MTSLSRSSSNNDSNLVNTIWLGIVHRNEKAVYVSFSSPVSFWIVSLRTEPNLSIISQGISCYGTNEYKAINPQTRYPPGDYSIGVGSDSNMTTTTGVFLQISSSGISNFEIYQLLSGVCRLLGTEPSHLLAQPARSGATNASISRKIKSSLEEIRKELWEKLEQITPKKPEITVDVTEITKLKKDYDQLYQRLKEAEDYIEELEAVNG